MVKMLIIVPLTAVSLTLSGCYQIASTAVSVIPGQSISNLFSDKAGSDADITKLVLSAPTSRKVFVQMTKKAAVKLGYNVDSINMYGDDTMVRTSKLITNMGIIGFGRGRDQSTVTISLRGNRTVNISASDSHRGRSGDVQTATQVASNFKSQIQKAYGE